MERITTFWGILRDAFREFRQNDPLRLAAATSFFTSFALPPILVILIEVLGLFGNPRTIRRELFEQLGTAIDKNIASQIREILRNLHYLALSPGMRFAVFIFLLFVATTLFEVIKNSLNQLWRIRLKQHQGIGILLLYRARSIGIIFIAGLLFSLVILGENTRGWLLPQLASGFLYRVTTLAASITWFSLLLKFLSYGRPAWTTAIAGGVFTGLFFTLGEMLLHVVFSFNSMKTIYGASTSLVLLLLFVFYCSFIFYFGACFTQALAVQTGKPILPARYAMSIP
jgi:membrane protein